MNTRTVPLAAALLAALLAAAPARAGEVRAGEETRASITIRNLSVLDAEDLRLEAASSAPWLTVRAPSGLPPVPAGKAATFEIVLAAAPEAEWGDEARIELALTLRFAGEADRTFPIRHTVTALPAREKDGKTGAAPVPCAFEWLLIEAKPDTWSNRVDLTVKNTGDAAIHGFTLHLGVTTPEVRPAVAVVSEPEVEAGKGIPPGIPPGGSRTFPILFVVSERAAPGGTGVISVRGRPATRTSPPLYQAALLVAVAAGAPGGRGNFEGFACYNVPPPGGGKPSADSRDWLPVPRGTAVIVAQVYELPGPRGLTKDVEQFVGYGHVLDDRGWFRLRVDPVGQPPWRFRLVAETMAHEMRRQRDEAGGERIVAGRARAAVTPSGRRTYRVISHVFRAVRDAQTEGRREEGMIIPLPNQIRSAFVDGRRILLPYFGYETALVPDRDPGILIEWEGELSTGGHINHWGGGETMSSFLGGEVGGVGYDEMLAEATNLPGLIWHNRPELLHILSHVVRAQDRLRSILPEAGADPGPEPSAGKPTPSIPPAIALWKPGLRLAPGETGYWLMEDSLWRLAVSGDPEDPDEADADLVLRGYGAAVRRHLLEDGAPDAAPLKPAERRYRYDRPLDPDRAFALGFDTFFACAVAGRPSLSNDFASDERARTERSIDLAGLLAELKEAERANGEEVLLRAEFARRRGLGNPGAMAAGLWLAWRELGDGFLREMLSPPPGEVTALARFLALVAEQAPGLARDFATLGLMPRVTLLPDPAVASETIPPEDLVVLYDGRGLSSGGEIRAFLELSGGGQGTLVPIPLGGSEARGLVSPGTFVPAAKDGAPSGFAFRPGDRVSFRVVTRIGESEPLPGPSGSFAPRVPAARVGPAGGRIGFTDRDGRRASFTVPEGALDDPQEISVNALAAPPKVGDRKVMGETFYRVNGTRYGKPARIALPYDPSSLPPGSPPPAVHRLSEETGEWENLGGEEIRPGLVEAAVTRTSLFALLLDPRPPAASGPRDGPDPFDPEDDGTWTVRFRLGGRAEVTLLVTDAEGRPVARPAVSRPMEAGPAELSWDGRDDSGNPAPDGSYGYVLETRDGAGRPGEPASGRLRIHRGFTGGVRGRAVAGKGEPGALVTVASVHGSAFTVADPDGAFSFLALPPGEERLRFFARGHFDEERAVTVRELAKTDLPEVRLTDRALTALAVRPAVIHPDAGPAEPALPARAGIALAFDRGCEVRVEVSDRRGRVVRTLFAGPISPGELGLDFDGADDRGRPLAGLHLVRVTARAGGVDVVQGEERVLVDRGLVAYARMIPRILSPDGDGLDDETRLTFRLADLAAVTAIVTGASGGPVRRLLEDASFEEGWHEVLWDGRDDEGQLLPEGPYRFVVTARYETGESSRPVRGEVALDMATPRFLEIEPANGAELSTGRPMIRARLAPAADLDPDSLRVKIDELVVSPDHFDAASGVLTYTPKTSLGEGVHIALVYARDLAGNMAEPEATSFTVKLAEPDRTRPAGGTGWSRSRRRSPSSLTGLRRR
ncbi:MAG: hypothetical protein MUE73_04760 [Planctomycetes bacterium]|nr:hypothetical protein [Planctomycetota bacterium]